MKCMGKVVLDISMSLDGFIPEGVGIKLPMRPIPSLFSVNQMFSSGSPVIPWGLLSGVGIGFSTKVCV